MAWKDIKPFSFDPVPKGTYPLALESYEVKTTKPEKGSRLMYVAHFRVEQSDCEEINAYAGRTLTDWFVVGSDDDAGAEDVATLNNEENTGVRKIRRLAEASEVEPDDPEADVTTDMINSILDGCVGVTVTASVNNKDDLNNVSAYFKVGERPLGLATKGGAKKSAPVSGKPDKPTIYDAQKAAVAKAVNAAKVAPKTFVEEDDEEETPPPSKKGKAKAEEKPKKKAVNVSCPIGCGKQIAYKDLSSHVDECTGEPTDDGEDDE